MYYLSILLYVHFSMETQYLFTCIYYNNGGGGGKFWGITNF